jgi:hypothetical protein
MFLEFPFYQAPRQASAGPLTQKSGELKPLKTPRKTGSISFDWGKLSHKETLKKPLMGFLIFF